MGMISFEWLGDEIKKSPVVDNDFGESFILGVMYKL
jgi:outer membrane scaffolding protein for murein synthesis (MipA/OmpV family)